MSQENVEVVNELLAEFKRTLRSVPRLLAPDFVWDMSTFSGWPDDPEYRGPEGFDRFFAAWVAPWESWSVEANETISLADDRVLVLMRQWGTPCGGQASVELHYATVYTLREGLVTRAQIYASHEEALAAVGLRE